MPPVQKNEIQFQKSDGSKWAARVSGRMFVLYQKEKPSEAQIVDRITYAVEFNKTDRKDFVARLDEKGFVHHPGGDPARTHPDTVIHYIDWNGVVYRGLLKPAH